MKTDNISQEHVLTVGRLKIIRNYVECFEQPGDEELYNELIKAVDIPPSGEDHTPYSPEISLKYMKYHKTLPEDVKEFIEDSYRSMLSKQHSE